MTPSSDSSDSPSLDLRLERLERAVEALSARLERLESGVLPGAVTALAPAETAPEPETGSRAAGSPGIETRLPQWAPALPRLDWETFIGGQGALWVGSAAIFLAVAFFLAYAWQFLGPAGRSLLGFLLGTGLMALGALSRKRSRGWFGVGLMGAGLAILYLNTWAGFQRSGLFGGEAAFAMMIATTLTGVILAVRLSAVTLVSLATLGGFMTPLVLGSASDALPALLYVAVLNTGIVATALFKHWKLPVWLSFIGTTLLLLALLFTGRLDGLEALTFAFTTLYFAQFFGASCFYSLLRKETTPTEDLFLPCLAALAYAVFGYGLTHEALGPFRVLFPLSLTAFFGAVAWVAARRVPDNLSFRNACTGLAIFFLTLAAPIQFDAGWLPAAWAAEAALLESIGVRFGSPLFRRTSHGVFGLYALALLVLFLPTPVPFEATTRAMALGVGVIVMSWLVYWTARWKPDARAIAPYAWLAVAGLAALVLHQLLDVSGWGHARDPYLVAVSLWALIAAGSHALGCRLGAWPGLPALRHAGFALLVGATGSLLLLGSWGDVRPVLNLRHLAYALLTGSALSMAARRFELPPSEARFLERVPLLASVTGIWALTLETFAAFQNSGIPDWERPAQLGISLWWTLSGALLLAYGVRRHSRGFRLLALGVLGVTALKVFLHDLSSLDTPLRILSFGGLGVVLLGISWLYSRFGLQRDPE